MVLCLFPFCCTLLSSFDIILVGKRELVALTCLSSWYLVTVIVLRLFLTRPWVGLQCVIVEFADLTHVLFGSFKSTIMILKA